MSKRNYNFHLKLSTIKKPKLDISIVSSQNTSTSVTVGNQNGNIKESSKAIKGFITSDHFWSDDDDEEFIKLASQEVSRFENINSSQLNNTYRNFNKALTSSTQHENKNDMFGPIEDDLIFSELTEFDNIEVGIDKQIDDYLQNGGTINTQYTSEFKVPIINEKKTVASKLQQSQTKSTVHIPKPSTSIPSQHINSNQTKHNAKEAQVNFLMNKIDLLKSEINKLKSDNLNMNECIQTKDGEVTMIRYELTETKRKIEKLRIEKIEEVESMKKESLAKIQDMEKLIQSHHSELQFKSIEIHNLKSKSMNTNVKTAEYQKVDIAKELKGIGNFQNFKVSLLYTESPNFIIDTRILEPANNKLSIGKSQSNNNRSDIILLNYLTEIQLMLSKLNINNFDIHKNKSIINSLFRISADTLRVFKGICKSFDFIQYTDLQSNPKYEYNYLCKVITRLHILYSTHPPNEICIYQDKEMYKNEKAILARRIIAALSIICYNSNYFSNLLINQPIINADDDKIDNAPSFIKILTEILKTIGYSNVLYEHNGFVGASCRLINSLVETYKSSTNESDDTLLQFLRELIYSRPDPSALVDILEFLLKMSHLSLPFITSLCWQCPADSLVLNNDYKILQFSSDSCIVQIFGTLLETAFSQYKPLKRKEIKILIKLTKYLIKFIRLCCSNGILWFNESTDYNTSCDCYNKLVTSFIILFHLCLKTWIYKPEEIDKKVISTIARNGALVICDLFHINYRKEILQHGGNPIKNRLHVIYDWLNTNKNEFKFKLPHEKALETINLRMIIVDYLKKEIDDKIPLDNDDGESEWNQLFDNFFVE